MHIKRIASILNLQRKSAGGVIGKSRPRKGRGFVRLTLTTNVAFPTLSHAGEHESARRRARLDRHDRDPPRRPCRRLLRARAHRRPAQVPVGRRDLRFQLASRMDGVRLVRRSQLGARRADSRGGRLRSSHICASSRAASPAARGEAQHDPHRHHRGRLRRLRLDPVRGRSPVAGGAAGRPMPHPCETAILDRLRAMRGPGESDSDVILRIAAQK